MNAEPGIEPQTAALFQPARHQGKEVLHASPQPYTQCADVDSRRHPHLGNLALAAQIPAHGPADSQPRAVTPGPTQTADSSLDDFRHNSKKGTQSTWSTSPSITGKAQPIKCIRPALSRRT